MVLQPGQSRAVELAPTAECTPTSPLALTTWFPVLHQQLGHGVRPARFSVAPCVTAVQSCHSIKFTNPSDVTVAISYRPNGRQLDRTLRIKAGRSSTVRSCRAS